MKRFVFALTSIAMISLSAPAYAIGFGGSQVAAVKTAIQDRIEDLEAEAATLNDEVVVLAAGAQTPESIAEQARLNDEISALNLQIGQLQIAGQQGMAKIFGAITTFNLNVSPHMP